MSPKYKNDGIMKVLVLLGAVVGLATIILRLANFDAYGFVYPLEDALNVVIIFIVGLVIVIITFWVGLKPDDPIPFHWLMFIILAILLVVFGAGIWACVLVLIAGLIGIIEEL